MKICTTCKNNKSPEEMVPDKRNKDGLSARCKLCESEYQKNHYKKNHARHKAKNAEWYLKNKEKRNKASLEWHQKNPRQSHHFQLKRYGLTIEQYEAMLTAQQSVCKICQKPENNKRAKNLSVDHDHTTGKVRGLLCKNCNTALGLIKEDIDTAQNLVQYILNTKEKLR